jgi:hypothetical protein
VTDRREPTARLHLSKAKELSSLDPRHARAFGHLGELSNVVGQIEVPNLHINDLLARYAAQPIHYLSIDVEGGDLAILRAMDFERFRPRIMSCGPAGEIHPGNPQQMLETMSRAGYEAVAQTFVNLIFVDRRWLGGSYCSRPL